MTRRLRTAVTASLTLAVVLAVLGALAWPTGATAAPGVMPLSFSFAGLMPGDARTKSSPYHLAQDATVERAAVTTASTGVTWRATLCGSAGSCVDLLHVRAGDELAAGDYTLTVGVTAGAIRPDERHSLAGRIVFVERPSGALAHTGSAVLPLVTSAVALGLLGLLMVLAARRRERDATSSLEIRA